MADPPLVPRQPKMKYTSHHIVVFVITFLAYAFFHATRKSFSNIKKVLAEEWTPAFHNATFPPIQPDNLWNSHHFYSKEHGKDLQTFLGFMDCTFMSAYAIGLFISGSLGDRLNLRYFLASGMMLSATSIFVCLVLTEWVHFYSEPFYLIVWFLNGLFQSTGWPSVVSIMGHWFGKSHRGLIFGLWSANQSVGNIMGTVIVVATLKFGYDFATLVPVTMLFCGGIVILFGLLVSPSEIGLSDSPSEGLLDENIPSSPPFSPDSSSYQPVEGENSGDGCIENSGGSMSGCIPKTTNVGSQIRRRMDDTSPLLNDDDDAEIDSDEAPKEEEVPISFIQALLLPGVLPYSLAYFCLKLVNYCFFFWLPYYLANNFDWSQKKADDLSIWYDIGGICGGLLMGIVSDRLGYRAPVIFAMLVVTIPVLYVYQSLPANETDNAVGLFILGYLIGGVANIIAGAVSADLGKQIGKSALATVTGIIDGTGSVGAALGQFLVPIIEEHAGWKSVFYMFIVATILTMICLGPLTYRESKPFIWKIQSLCRRGRHGSRRNSAEHPPHQQPINE